MAEGRQAFGKDAAGAMGGIPQVEDRVRRELMMQFMASGKEGQAVDAAALKPHIR